MPPINTSDLQEMLRFACPVLGGLIAAVAVLCYCKIKRIELKSLASITFAVGAAVVVGGLAGGLISIFVVSR